MYRYKDVTGGIKPLPENSVMMKILKFKLFLFKLFMQGSGRVSSQVSAYAKQ